MVYMIYSFFHRKVPALPEAQKNHKYAILISARNEEAVIHELLNSLNAQTYPRDKYTIFLCADNCTDHTADAARKLGAVVYERQNKQEVGKGYALNFMYHHIVDDYGLGAFEAFIVFDADNIVDQNFLREVNKTFDTGKYDALTTYRNSKNFGTNWISAAYSIWFMHEARHLNYPRMMMGAQCMISGTGFLVSDKVMQMNDGWPFYLMTEDIQFSVVSTLHHLKIGYCDTAILYDEQPTTMSQSWRQRLRWAKGFYQIDGRYLGALAKGFFHNKGKRLGFYDVLLTVLPCSLLTVIILGFALWLFGAGAVMPYFVRLVFWHELLGFLGIMILNMWAGLMAMAALTVYMEWNRIHTDNWTKIKYIWLFPLYLLTYIPISVQAMFVKVKWTPIQHYTTAQLEAARTR